MKETTKELFKEASDVIDELIEKVASKEEENEQLRIELLNYKEASEREQIATILEEKSLTSMAKIASLRNGSLDSKEFNRLKTIANSNLVDSNFEYGNTQVKVAEDKPETPIEALERRSQERREQIYNGLQNIIHK